MEAIDPRRYSATVHQALGMICVQCDCTIAEAIVRLNLRAHAAEVTVDDVASAVVDRSIRFAD